MKFRFYSFLAGMNATALLISVIERNFPMAAVSLAGYYFCYLMEEKKA